MTSPALQQAEAIGAVDGPLAGYHREWYVVRPRGELTRLGRVKIGEPREDALRFDRRYFASEDEVLLDLARLGVPRVPPVHRVSRSGTVFHGFIEGRTLASLSPRGHPVAPGHLRQISERFASLSRLRPGDLHARRLRNPLRRAPEPDGIPPRPTGDSEHRPVRSSAHFLRELLAFTREHAHRARLPRFGPLFARLGIPPDVLGPHSRLAAEAALLTDRPSCLLHGDLHRANLIVDPADALWTIDWELAAFGDPLYDLATHLHLMDYPPRQRSLVVAEWRQAVTAVLPGADAGLADDLPRYLGYKRAQSVFADVVRQAVAVGAAHGTPAWAEQLGRTAELVHDILVRAAEPLELADVPGPGAIEPAYAELCTAARHR
ncbi:aminoglycoside phosphotransferase family protein [Streptomyces sp. AA1529]|uniref:aminoglycoside phosphotransferase family protein n=1 Tax=Streptomyces sp. AA1529 TaxID=1203257 RepID=UPI000310533A|nr:aminoglycoside phosphotransferase family protein [Streptomyces sp. AA1529]